LEAEGGRAVTERQHDVVIVGASFAGLAVASRLRGDVLLVDSRPLGSLRRSACGTFLSVVRTLGLEDAIEQVSELALLHAPGVPEFELEDPLCTVDYERFCRGLLAQGSATFIEASIHRIEDEGETVVVTTSQGRFRARCVVDASGWHAAAGSLVAPGLVDRSALSYGLETDAGYTTDHFYFWLDRATIESGVAWIFPAGGASRMGLASYRGPEVKAAAVRAFTRITGAEPSAFHGGYFPSRLRAPLAGPLFLVGDAAGHCLPLTGEGIRPALFFGQRLGDLLQEVIEGRLTPDQARTAYRKAVRRFRLHYRFLGAAQRWLPGLPKPLLRRFIRFISIRRVERWCLRRYLGMMPLHWPLAATGASRQQTAGRHDAGALLTTGTMRKGASQ